METCGHVPALGQETQCEHLFCSQSSSIGRVWSSFDRTAFGPWTYTMHPCIFKLVYSREKKETSQDSEGESERTL